jgi:hypothetical protein
MDLIRHDIIHALDLLLNVSFSSVAEAQRKVRAIMKNHNSAVERNRESLRKCELAEQVISLLVYFSLGPTPCVDSMVFEGVIPHLLPLLNWRYTQMFPVSAKAKLRTEGLVQNKQLIAKLQDIDMRVTRKNYVMYFKGDPPAILNTHKGKILHLFDTTNENVDIDIAAELRRGNYVMESCYVPVIPGDMAWTDVEVKTVIGPCQYWAWLGGEKTRSLIAKIETALMKLFVDERLLVAPPVVGDIVAVSMSAQGPYRGCVLYSSEEKVRVFAMDHGFVKELPRDGLYIMDSATRDIPPQAVYCELNGM